MEKKLIKLDKQTSDDGAVSVFLLLDTELIRKGILTKLTPAQLKILIAIASHMDEKGEAFPSMRYLSEITGVSVNTICTAVKGLLEVRIDGLPIILRRLEGKGARKKSKYYFNINTDTPILEEVDEEVRLTAKNHILQYCRI